MKKNLLFIAIGVLILALAACSPEGEPAEEAVAAAPTKVIADTPAPTDTVAPTATVPPTIAPTEAPEEVAMADASQCLDCHADKDRLIQTAAPVVEVASESSGPG